MVFIWPLMLLFLLLIPVFAVLYVRALRRRRQLVAKYGSLGWMQNAVGRNPGFRRHIPPILFLVALSVLIFALARPQMVVSLPRVEGTVILTFDVSGSMAAEDIKPSRMEAAKAAARDFVKRQPSTVLIGVVAFSDSGFAGQVPTNEKDTILAAIDRLGPQRGTSVSQGIQAALKTIETASQPPEILYSSLAQTPTPSPTPMPKGTYTNAIIILLSDGENNMNPNPFIAAQVAADRGVRIFTIGVGSAAGTNLHINGFTVHTQLDEATLQQISQLTDGVYYNAVSDEDLRSIYNNIGPQLIIKPEKLEVTSLFAGVGIFILLIGGALSLAWFSRLP
jgi:Ca-activated chloride channel family protein